MDWMGEETLKFGGGSLMMWGCMLWDGAGQACKINGAMDAELYCRIFTAWIQLFSAVENGYNIFLTLLML